MTSRAAAGSLFAAGDETDGVVTNGLRHSLGAARSHRVARLAPQTNGKATQMWRISRISRMPFEGTDA
jgi:hypothetical protein